MASPTHVTLMDKVREDSSTYSSQYSGRSDEKYPTNSNTGTFNTTYSSTTTNSNTQTKIGKTGSNRASLEAPFPHLLQTSLESKEEENGYKGNVLSFVVKHLLAEFREHCRRKIDRVLGIQTVCFFLLQ